jgi:hypothetical protein
MSFLVLVFFDIKARSWDFGHLNLRAARWSRKSDIASAYGTSRLMYITMAARP